MRAALPQAFCSVVLVLRAVFNRLDAEPGATQEALEEPPCVPPSQGGKKDQTPPTFPPLRRGGRGGESRGACNASENRSNQGAGRSHPPSGTKETWVAPFASYDADNPRAFSERGFIGRLNRMSQVHDTSVIDRLLEPFGRALTPALARTLVDLRRAFGRAGPDRRARREMQ